MSEFLTEVHCQRPECMFFKEDVHLARGKAHCQHEDKPHYLRSLPCPLYRMDVHRQMRQHAASTHALLNMIRPRQ